MGIFTTRSRLTQLVIAVFVLQASLFVLKVDARNPPAGGPGGRRPGAMYKRMLDSFGCFGGCEEFEEEDISAECEEEACFDTEAFEHCENLELEVCRNEQEACCRTDANCFSENEFMSSFCKRQFGCFGCGRGCNEFEDFTEAECEEEERFNTEAFEECENLQIEVCCNEQEACFRTNAECESEAEFSDFNCRKRSTHPGGSRNKGSHLKRSCFFGDDIMEAECEEEERFNTEAFEECENLEISVCCNEQEARFRTNAECESESEFTDFECKKRSYPVANKYKRSRGPSRTQGSMYKRSRGPTQGNMRPYYKRSRGTNAPSNSRYYRRSFGQPARSPSRGALYKRFVGPCDSFGCDPFFCDPIDPFFCDPFDPFFFEECECENDGCDNVCRPIDVHLHIDPDVFVECDEDCEFDDCFEPGFFF